MIYSDPPYNISLDYSKGIGGKGKYGGDVNDNKTYDEYKDFLKDTIHAGLSVLNKNAHIFYWCDQSYIGTIQDIYRGMKITNRRVCMWIKNNQNPTPSIAFNKCYEPCVYGTIGKPYLSSFKKLNEVLNKEMTSGNNLHQEIMEFIDIWAISRENTSKYEHPTQKPITLHEKPLKRCTAVGNIVLDLFGGSGSTLIACEQLKRKAFLVEKDPVFVEVIIRRWEQWTGLEAKKIS